MSPPPSTPHVTLKVSWDSPPKAPRVLGRVLTSLPQTGHRRANGLGTTSPSAQVNSDLLSRPHTQRCSF